MDNQAINLKKINRAVNWTRLCMVSSISCTILSVFAIMLFLYVMPLLMFTLIIPFIFFIPSVFQDVADFYSNLQSVWLLYFVTGVAYLSIILNVVSRIVTCCLLNKTDFNNKDLNYSKSTFAVLCIFFPLISSTVFLSKVKNANEQEQVSANQVSIIANDNIVKTQINKCRFQLKSTIIFYSLWALIIIILVSVDNNSEYFVGFEVISVDFLLISIFACIIYWIIKYYRDRGINYNNEELDSVKRKYARLTFWCRIIGNYRFLKILKAQVGSSNNKGPTIKITKEWTDENNTHWGMSEDGKYFYTTNGDWTPYN